MDRGTNSLNFVFVLGTGCCGSSLVQEIICRHRQVGFVSNFDDRLAKLNLRGRLNSKIYQHVRPSWTVKGRVRFAPSEGYLLLERYVSQVVAFPGRPLLPADAEPSLVEAIRRFYIRRYTAQHKPLFLHKFTGWSRAGLLHVAFPRARFVHVIRDGRAVANSFVHKGWWLTGQGASTAWLEAGGHDRYAEEWSRIERSYPMLAAIAWKSMIDAYEEARAEIPEEQWLEIRYEDLVDDPAAVLDRVLKFVELPPDAGLTEAISDYPIDHDRGWMFRQDFDQETLDRLQVSLAVHLGRLGYA
jgi:hypothetical protein